MSTAVGRPGPTHASTSRQQPYPQPGVAKPPQARATAAQQLQRQLLDRQTIRAKYQRIFGSPTYLEPGPSNRLVLSVRSGVPAEVDFGLTRLIQVSFLDPDLLRLVEFPGLLDGLLGLIREYVDRRKADRATGVPALAAALGEEPREAVRRRAAEAALVLRNLLPGRGSSEVVNGSKRLKKLICDVLDEGNGEGIQAEETTELRLYLLEVLETMADKAPLALPGHAITPDVAPGEEEDDSRPPPKPEPLDSPAVRLFPLLVALTRSNDRALILSAFRCLTVLSTNNKSDSVLAFLTYDAVAPLPKPHPHPIQTAIELLPLADSELNTAILDFIYQHTTLPSNAVLFATRPELLSILRLVCSKFHIKGKREHVEINLHVAQTDATKWHNALPKPHLRKPLPQTHADSDGPVSRDELEGILRMKEPERCIAWMRLAFEPHAESDIPQISFWQSYQTLFAPHMAPGIPPMLTASDVIKHANDGHPSAQPVVVMEPERKFVIRGIRQRERPELQSRVRCLWKSCPSSDVINSPIACYHHLHDTHLALPSVPSDCAWQGCTYSSSQPDPSLRLADLSVHVRTHLPPLTTPTPPTPAELSDLPAILHHERHHAERDPLTGKDPTAAGPSLLSVLIIRNIARVAKLALDAKASSSGVSSAGPTSGGGASVASGNAAIGRLAGDEQSIFEAFAAAAEGLAKKDGVLSRLEKVDYTAAFPAVEALLAIEETLTKMLLSDAALGKVLAEVAVLVEHCRTKAQKLLQKKKPELPVFGREVEMQEA
ncbi:hypothetical protein JCM10213_006551 [Rhodosporidiobolus nylandii]